MAQENYMSKIIRFENIIFGVFWGAISIFVGSYLIKFIDTINKIVGFIIEALIMIIGFPAQMATKLGIEGLAMWIVAVIVGVALAPIAKVIFDWIRGALKKNPL